MTKNNVESRLPFIMPALIKSEILGLSPPPRRQTSGIYLFINGKYAYVIATIDRKKPPKKKRRAKRILPPAPPVLHCLSAAALYANSGMG